MASSESSDAGEDVQAEMETKFVGEELPQTDGRKFVTGRAKYVADHVMPHQAHMGLVRSIHGHAKLEEVDVSKALAMDGVVDVITGEDVHEATNPKGIHEEEFAMAKDRVRYSGEPIAAVAAENPRIAADAVEAIDVTYVRLEPAVDPAAAVEDDAPVVHPELQDLDDVDGNVSQSFEQRVGDIEAGFEEADRIVERTYRAPPINGAPMEPHGCVVEYDTAENEIISHTTTQVMHPHKETLAAVFGLPVNSVQVKVAEIGGAFGNKLNVLPHEVCAILLSKRIERPVKSVLSRQEHLELSKSSFQYVMDVKVGVKNDGTITAWEEEILQDEGAYHESGLYIVGGAAGNTRLLGYKIPNIHLDGKVVYTNTTPGAPVRGTGVRQLAYARESLISELAEDLGIDPIEMRTQQSVSNDETPYETPTGNLIPNTGMNAAIERAKEIADYESLKDQVADEPYTGVGVAVGYHVSSCRGRLHDQDSTTVTLRMEGDGSLTLGTTASDMGTSTRTTLAQVCCDVMGVDPDQVKIHDADTEETPPADGSHSSRTMAIMGTATHDAAVELRDSVKQIAAEKLEARLEDIALQDGEAVIRGTDRGMTLAEVAATAYHNKSGLPEGMDAGDVNVTATFDTLDDRVATRTEPTNENAVGNISMDYPCSAQIVIASVDPDTGRATVDEHVVVDDVGKAVNPLVVEGQIEGGAVQGIGMALWEKLDYDEASGRVSNPNFTDYKVPPITDVPYVKSDYVEVESESTPGGWKGVAEGPFIVAPAAVANAVCDAIGGHLTELPLSPERVKQSIEESE